MNAESEKQNSISEECKTDPIQESKKVLNYHKWKSFCSVSPKLLDFILIILHTFLCPFLNKPENELNILEHLRKVIREIINKTKEQIEKISKVERQSIFDEICNQLDIIHPEVLKERIYDKLMDDVRSMFEKSSELSDNIERFKTGKKGKGFNYFLFNTYLIKNFNDYSPKLSEDEVMKVRCLITINDDTTNASYKDKEKFYEVLRSISEESDYKMQFYYHPHDIVFQDFDRVVDARMKVENTDDTENLSELIALYAIFLIMHSLYKSGIRNRIIF